MPGAKRSTEPRAEVEKSAEVVLVQFAYAAAKDGEVVQLVKGNSIDAGRFKPASLEHLRALGFIGSQD